MPKLTIDIEARLAQFQDALTSINRQADQFAGKFTSSIGAVKASLAGIAGAFTAGALISSFRGVLDAAENMNKLSQRTGITTETLSGFAVAAKLADVEQEDLATGLKKLAVNMAAAAGGSKEQAEVFKALGINLKGANGDLTSTDTVLREVASRFESFQDGPEKAALAVALFGKAGDALIPFLNNLRRSEDEARKLGVVIGSDFARQAEEFNDNLKRIGIASSRAGISIANDLLPRLVDISNEMVATMDKSNRFVAFFEAVAKVLGLVATEAEKASQELERLAALDRQIAKLGSAPTGAFGRNPTVQKQLDALVAERNALQKELGRRAELKAFADSRSPEEDLLFSGKTKAPIVDRREKTGPSPFEQELKSLQRELIRSQAEGNKFIEIQERIAGGEFGKLTTGQAQQLKSVAAAIMQANDERRLAKELEDGLLENAKERVRLYNEQALAIHRQREEFLNLADPTRELEQRLRALGELQKTDNAIDPELADVAFFKIQQQIDRIRGTWGEFVGETESFRDVARDLGLTFESAFERAVIAGENFRDVLKGIAQDIVRIILRKTVTEPLSAAATGLIQTILKAVLPQAATGIDYVPRDMPVFVHKGEAIVPAKENRRGGGASVAITNHYTIDARSDRASIVAEIRASERRTLAQVKDLNDRGTLQLA